MEHRWSGRVPGNESVRPGARGHGAAMARLYEHAAFLEDLMAAQKGHLPQEVITALEGLLADVGRVAAEDEPGVDESAAHTSMDELMDTVLHWRTRLQPGANRRLC